MYEFKLPDLGEGIHEGEILKWHVELGQTVAEDAPLVDVETDKAAVTIPSPRGGTLARRIGEVGAIVMTGQVIAVIDDGTGAVAAESTPGPSALPPESPPADIPAPAVPSPGGPRRPIPAAPAIRRRARELGIDLEAVTPSGPAGRVVDADLQRHLSADPVAGGGGSTPDPPEPATGEPESVATAGATNIASAGIPFLEIEPLPDFETWGEVRREPLRSIRRRVARKMVTSMILVPHVAHMDEADVTELEAFRLREKGKRQGRPGGHLTLLSFVAKAVTAGLKAAPAFNASLDPFREELIYKSYYSLGIAVDTGRGLVVPVVRQTDRKSIVQISTAIEELAERARDGKLEVQELRGGTFTITNVGPIGGTALIPTINYPEVAILGMGRVQEKPVVRDGEIVIRKMLPLTLAFDHRVADGADAARFVTELVRHLSDPNLLLLET